MAARQLHEQVYFACWLKAMGVDETVGPSLIAAAFRAGWQAAVATVLPPVLAPYFPMQHVTTAQLAAIEAEVRRMHALPASPDVAAEMGGERDADGHH